MAENHIRILCSVIKVDLVYEAPDGSLVAFFDSIQDSPPHAVCACQRRTAFRHRRAESALPADGERWCVFCSPACRRGLPLYGADVQ